MRLLSHSMKSFITAALMTVMWSLFIRQHFVSAAFIWRLTPKIQKSRLRLRHGILELCSRVFLCQLGFMFELTCWFSLPVGR